MSKIYNKYENDVDKTWYHSSNIIYSECDDKENELKTVRIFFSTGRVYEYKGVKVNDYLMFRESSSQGQALNKYIKTYECERLEDANVEDVKNAMYDYSSGTTQSDCDYYVELSDEKAEIFCQGNKMETVDLNETPKNVLQNFMSAVKIDFKVVE